MRWAWPLWRSTALLTPNILNNWRSWQSGARQWPETDHTGTPVIAGCASATRTQEQLSWIRPKIPLNAVHPLSNNGQPCGSTSRKPWSSCCPSSCPIMWEGWRSTGLEDVASVSQGKECCTWRSTHAELAKLVNWMALAFQFSLSFTYKNSWTLVLHFACEKGNGFRKRNFMSSWTRNVHSLFFSVCN